MKQIPSPCSDVPQFDRLTYFYGQMLHARDLQLEQAYFREKLKLHNRCLHGWGVVCGLEVTPPPSDPTCEPVTDVRRDAIDKKIQELRQQFTNATDPAKKKAIEAEIERLQQEKERLPPPADCSPAESRTKVQISCGLAIDCEGNEIVVRQPMLVDLWSALSPEDRTRLDAGEKDSLYVAVCWRECPVDPVRPVIPDACGATAECLYGKMRDSVSVVVTLDGDRWKDTRCETCCEDCGECCVLLARIDGFAKGQPLPAGAIHQEVRRPISLYQATTVVGVNWVQGGTYTPDQVDTLVGSLSDKTGGLTLKLSRPIRTETLVPGVMDVWVIEGGKGRSAGIYNKAGAIDVPATPTTDTIVFRDDTGESLNDGDRVIVTLRASFLLDECCRPVDGANVGGRVPLLPDSPPVTTTPSLTGCAVPPGGIGPWTSGAGAGAASFESWFYVQKS